MLKRRLIATLIIREEIVVQSIQFRKYLPVGKPEIAVEFLNSWGIDEIVILDISASMNELRKHPDPIRKIARSCFVPVTIGGGVKTIEDIKILLQCGADKICINSICLNSPGFITEAADIFGNQCIIVSMDVVGSSAKDYRVYNSAGGVYSELHPVDWAKEVESRGAGEIYLTSVFRDGTKTGFDLGLIEMIVGNVEIPVIASGGAGNPGHIIDVFANTNASAVSAANYFHFSEHSVITTKAVLLREQTNIRLNTHANYDASSFDDDFRLKKHSENYLQHLLFEKIEKEII